ncbi:MAG: M20/M25/M40 family metallo-hydrolase [Gemmatimonadetes bacterium]|nr:M20/M25/M40 family metallo-hydrolase [Gemmatimonadota bacterium]
MRKATILGVLLIAPLTPALVAQNGVADAVSSITAEDFLRRVGIIAHDSMRGRNTPSPELDQTAEYLASEFRKMGLLPGAGGGSFIQRYPLRRERVDIVASGVSIPGGRTLRLGTDVIVLSGGTTGPRGISGPVVVVSGAPGDAQSFEDLDVRRAVVLVVASGSDSWSRRELRGLQQQGPAAVVILTLRSDSAWRTAQRGLDRVFLRKAWGRRPGGMPVVEVRQEAIEGALEASGFDLAAARLRGDEPLETERISGFNITINLEYQTVEELTAPNVVAILEGSDPTLRDEYVTFSAHMDHVGVGNPVNGDSIYNGADDDASGTIAVLEAAEAFATLHPRPRRSLMFVIVSGEEKGLWGSEYFTDNPSVPIENIVANLNTDMVGRNWKDTIVAIGKEHSNLGETLDRVNARHPELGMTAIDDIWPNQRFYFRSDHYNFARKGIPILFFFNGTHEDYHRPSDHVEKIDGEKAARIVKLVFFLGLDIANADQRPQWYPESYRRIVEGN